MYVAYEYPSGIRVGEAHYTEHASRQDLLEDAADFAVRTNRPYVWAKVAGVSTKVQAAAEPKAWNAL